jgi:ketosteroid isomerase-like protein
MSNATAKLSAEDRLDIMELFAKYAWAIDSGDAEGVLKCFAEDALLDHLWQGKMVGHEKIRRAFEELWYDRPSWWIGRQHLANHFVIEREGDGARVKAFFSILQYNVEYRTNFVFGIGTWDNFCVKRGGRWVFQSLKVNAWMDRNTVLWVGDSRATTSGPKIAADASPAYAAQAPPKVGVR